MSTGYKIMCPLCDAISYDIGTSGEFHEPELAVSFIRKHWNCKTDGIKIVSADTYGPVDCRIDDCQPNTLPKWDKIITLTGMALEEEEKFQKECEERLGIIDYSYKRVRDNMN